MCRKREKFLFSGCKLLQIVITYLTQVFSFFFPPPFYIKLESLEELPEMSGKTTRRFFFNLTSIPTEEFITSAELQVFREQMQENLENFSIWGVTA